MATATIGRPPVDPRIRISSKFTIGDGCWEWTAGRNADGYGQFDGQHAHRALYEMVVGPIPEGLQLDHVKERCGLRHCVRPSHMEPVTNRVNVLRGDGPTAVNARKTHCKRGHEFTSENTYTWHNMRTCRACRRERRNG